ncbi:STAS domain-containing protein [Actinosynnema pretiosum]|uniref:Anti-anti-sigma factor n=1 Tax=Actinosynnema pretiosum TaxID=42197 RepID=A0A290Z8D0_9PSEU|nr:STAS domain-containing protein [Actinosynnema pretiosum]ATE55245.1 anti-anti-sigma factor [Actinosynnema pretiosum]
MNPELTLATTSRADGAVVLTVAGEIDMANAARFTGALAEAVRGAPPGGGPVVVDLVGVGYLDSAALSGLFAHAERVEVVAGELLEAVLTVSGLAAITSVRIVGE